MRQYQTVSAGKYYYPKLPKLRRLSKDIHVLPFNTLETSLNKVHKDICNVLRLNEVKIYPLSKYDQDELKQLWSKKRMLLAQKEVYLDYQ